MRKMIVTIIIMIALVSTFWEVINFDLDNLPEGEYLNESMSPSGEYLMKFYVSYGHSTVAPALRGELHFLNKNIKPKNIFWQYRSDSVEVQWLTDEVILINKHALNVVVDTYDFRREGH